MIFDISSCKLKSDCGKLISYLETKRGNEVIAPITIEGLLESGLYKCQFTAKQKGEYEDIPILIDAVETESPNFVFQFNASSSQLDILFEGEKEYVVLMAEIAIWQGEEVYKSINEIEFKIFNSITGPGKTDPSGIEYPFVGDLITYADLDESVEKSLDAFGFSKNESGDVLIKERAIAQKGLSVPDATNPEDAVNLKTLEDKLLHEGVNTLGGAKGDIELIDGLQIKENNQLGIGTLQADSGIFDADIILDGELINNTGVFKTNLISDNNSKIILGNYVSSQPTAADANKVWLEISSVANGNDTSIRSYRIDAVTGKQESFYTRFKSIVADGIIANTYLRQTGSTANNTIDGTLTVGNTATFNSTTVFNGANNFIGKSTFENDSIFKGVSRFGGLVAFEGVVDFWSGATRNTKTNPIATDIMNKQMVDDAINNSVHTTIDGVGGQILLGNNLEIGNKTLKVSDSIAVKNINIADGKILCPFKLGDGKKIILGDYVENPTIADSGKKWFELSNIYTLNANIECYGISSAGIKQRLTSLIFDQLGISAVSVVATNIIQNSTIGIARFDGTITSNGSAVFNGLTTFTSSVLVNGDMQFTRGSNGYMYALGDANGKVIYRWNDTVNNIQSDIFTLDNSSIVLEKPVTIKENCAFRKQTTYSGLATFNGATYFNNNVIFQSTLNANGVFTANTLSHHKNDAYFESKIVLWKNNTTLPFLVITASSLGAVFSRAPGSTSTEKSSVIFDPTTKASFNGEAVRATKSNPDNEDLMNKEMVDAMASTMVRVVALTRTQWDALPIAQKENPLIIYKVARI